MSRLAQQYRDVHAAFSSLPADRRRAAAERLVAMALDRNKLDRADATAPGAVDRLDEDAWDLQDQDDETVEGRRRYELAFRRARAAAAGTALTHAGTPLDEAVYEAIHALEPEVDVLDVLRT